MTIINRYLLKAFFRLFFLSLASFVGIFLLIDFFEKVDDFLEHGAAIHLYFLYLLHNIPVAAIQVVPMAVLLAAFGTIGGFSKTNELTAMRSGGISLLRMTTPLVMAALFLSLSVLAIAEYLVPINQKELHHILHIQVKGNAPIYYKRDRIWFREGNTITHVVLSDPQNQLLQGISLLTFNDNFNLVSRTDAPKATFSNKEWTFHQSVRRDFDPSTGQIKSATRKRVQNISLPKKPEDFQEAQHKTEHLGYGELRELVTKLQAEGYDARRYQVDMHAKLSRPFACLVMALLGIPFALKKGRGASLSLGVTLTLGTGMVYYIIQAVLLAFGYSSILPPAIAAWTCLILFSLIALWFMASARE